MKSFVLILLTLYLVFGAPPNKIVEDNAEVDSKNELHVQNFLPKSLIESIQLQKEYHQPRKARILNDFQFAQHSADTRSVYLPPVASHITDSAYPTTNTQEIVDFQVPTSANTNRVLLQLPSQKLPLHNTFGVPPRRHYRITLIRNRKPTLAPQLLSPEVEEKTLIYVLVKKPDQISAAQLDELNKTEQSNYKHNAPEVYFIKYKENNISNSSPNLTSTKEQTK